MEIIKLMGNEVGGGLRSNSYVIKHNNEFYILDPSHTLAEVRAVVGDFCIESQDMLTHNNAKNDSKNTLPILKGVFITHCHYDHIRAIEQYLEQKIPLFLSHKCWLAMQDEDKTLDKDLSIAIKKYKVDDTLLHFLSNCEVELFSGQKFWVKSTPGHTDCSICLYNDEHLFCGDLLFCHRGYGRFDLPTGSFIDLKQSLRWVNSLNSNVIVHSGHGQDFRLREWKN